MEIDRDFSVPARRMPERSREYGKIYYYNFIINDDRVKRQASAPVLKKRTGAALRLKLLMVHKAWREGVP